MKDKWHDVVGAAVAGAYQMAGAPAAPVVGGIAMCWLASISNQRP